MTSDLPRFVRDLLSACPQAGNGIHAWLFRCARQLHAHYSDQVEIVELLSAASFGCGRPVPRREIMAAVRGAKLCAWAPSGLNQANHTEEKWPAVDQQKRAEIIRNGIKLLDLWEASAIRVDWNESHTERLVDALFPGNPLLCCGRSSSEFATKPRKDWRGELAQIQLIVPNPMAAVWGKRKDDGKPSQHTLNNTGPRRFLVIEFDEGTFDEHAALLWHLAGIGPLALAVHSGSKSLHGWFYCQGQPEEKLYRFMRYAVILGADRATWLRSQFVRIPDGTRDNGKRQAVYYFRPEVVQ